MKIELELTEAEVKFVRAFCLLRVTKKAAELLETIEETGLDCGLPTDEVQQCRDALEEAGPIFENLRSKMVNAINMKEWKG